VTPKSFFKHRAEPLIERLSWRRKLTLPSISSFHERVASDLQTLVVYADAPDHSLPGDADRLPNFKAAGDPAAYSRSLAQVPSESYDQVVMTGLLEHVPDPVRLLSECRRVLRPGGAAFIRVSCVFPLHVAPNDYWHPTVFGMHSWLEEAGWERMEVHGTSTPFTTLAILAQRVYLQVKLGPIAKLSVVALTKFLPYLDRWAYSTKGPRDGAFLVDVMPSNLNVVARKDQA